MSVPVNELDLTVTDADRAVDPLKCIQLVLVADDEVWDQPFALLARAALPALARRLLALEAAVRKHHAQKADDRCIEDDDNLYAAAGLPPCDRRVGSKEEMLANCARFIDRRCEGGGWPSYRELEAKLLRLRTAIQDALPNIPDHIPRTTLRVALEETR